MKTNEKMKKALSILLCVLMLTQYVPTVAFAVDAAEDGLCAHHAEHTADCGYVAAAAGADCTHVHSESCYTRVACTEEHEGECTAETGCVTMEPDCHHTHGDCGYSEGTAEVPCGHQHDENCGYVEGAEENSCTHTEHIDCGYQKAAEGTPCTHACKVIVDSDASCYKLLCSHKDGGHDDTCGYVPAVAGQPCAYECAECAAEEPTEATEETTEVTEETTEATEPAPVCDCGTDDESIHATNCAVYVAPEDPACYCAEKCTEPNVWCDVCGFDYTACSGTDGHTGYEVNNPVLDISHGPIVLEEGQIVEGYYIDGTPYLNQYQYYSGSLMIVGVGRTNNTITVQSGTHNIVLDNCRIEADGCAFSIASGATVTLELIGDNTLKSGSNLPAISVPSGATLTIESDSGTLEATGGTGAAGIGGGAGGDAGTITINGGTVTATGGAGGGGGAGGDGGAGIGGAGGTITINGGTVTATGGKGFTSGGNGDSAGGDGGAGIGGGAGGTITINGGTVTATGGYGGYGGGNDGEDGAGIDGYGGTITINGGTVTATDGYNGAGIGGYDGTITINGGNINADVSSSPKDKEGNTLTKVTITLNGAEPDEKIYAIYDASDNLISYGLQDVKAFDDGKLYCYLPVMSGSDPEISAVVAGSNKYSFNDAWDGNSATFVKGNVFAYIDVKCEYGDMEFEYSGGTYDAETEQRKNQGWICAEANANRIVVTNNSNCNVNIVLEYISSDSLSAIGGELYTNPVDSNVFNGDNVATGTDKAAYLRLTGIDSCPWESDFTEIGAIRVVISESEPNSSSETDNVKKTIPVYAKIDSFAIDLTGGKGMRCTSGQEHQTVEYGEKMDSVVYMADEGYYFPEDYTEILDNVTRDSNTRITVSGILNGNLQLTLPAASECDHPSWNNGACTVCGYVCDPHIGGEATCTTQGVCDTCGASYTDPDNHNWVNGVCNNGCGTTHTPHDWSKEDGKCTDCGALHAHASSDLSNGKCTVCGLQFAASVYGVNFGTQWYEELTDAVAAMNDSTNDANELTLFKDAEGKITLTRGGRVNGGGYTLNGGITFGGTSWTLMDITIIGETAVTLNECELMFGVDVELQGTGADLRLSGWSTLHYDLYAPPENAYTVVRDPALAPGESIFIGRVRVEDVYESANAAAVVTLEPSDGFFDCALSHVVSELNVSLGDVTATAADGENSYTAVYNGGEAKIDGTMADSSSFADAFTVTWTQHDSTSAMDSAPVNAGVYDFTLAGKKGDGFDYSGVTITGTLTITPKRLDSLSVTLAPSEFIYDGKECTPAVTIPELTAGTDFTVAYSNNVNAGNATVTIQPVDNGNYSFDPKTVNFRIGKATLTTACFRVTLPESSPYNGEKREATVEPLVNGIGSVSVKYDMVDGSLVVEEPVDAGFYGVRIDVAEGVNYNAVTGLTAKNWNFGIGRATPTITCSTTNTVEYNGEDIDLSSLFTILPGDLPVRYSVVTFSGEGSMIGDTNYRVTALGDFIVAVNIDETTNYTSASASTLLTVLPGQPSYTQPTDLTGEYGQMLKDVTLPAGWAWEEPVSKLLKTGVETFEASFTPENTDLYEIVTDIPLKVTVAPASISGLTVNSIPDENYTGEPIEPFVVIRDLLRDRDYTVAYSNNTNAGTATVTITGIGNYTGTNTTSFTITPKGVPDPTIELSFDSAVYTGKAQEPGVVVKDGDTVIDESEYAVSCTNNTNAGTATVTITDKVGGNYTVSGSKTFTINKAELTITADSKVIYIGAELPTLTYTVSGLADGEVLTQEPSLTTNADKDKAGTYTITAANANAGDNYEISYVSGTLTIMDAETEVETRIEKTELTVVPEGLRNTEFNTVEKITEELVSRIVAAFTGYSEDNMEHYDVTLQFSLDGGRTWILATEDKFPTEGITVVLPYPEGTNARDYEFVVSHMFTVTSQRLGTTAGDVELPNVVETANGIRVTLNGLSPVTVAARYHDHTGGTATCTNKAICSVCGNAYGEMNAANHAGGTEVKNAREATCGADGYTGDTHCKGCGELLTKGTAIKANGEHTYGNWKVVKKATKTEKGEKQRTCSVCGHVDSEEIPVLSDTPATGDNSNILLWSGMLGVSALALAAIVADRKRRTATK